jgi:hypothetical protein
MSGPQSHADGLAGTTTLTTGESRSSVHHNGSNAPKPSGATFQTPVMKPFVLRVFTEGRVTISLVDIGRVVARVSHGTGNARITYTLREGWLCTCDLPGARYEVSRRRCPHIRAVSSVVRMDGEEW